jgi:hypothetical protein
VECEPAYMWRRLLKHQLYVSNDDNDYGNIITIDVAIPSDRNVTQKETKGKAIPLQALTGPEVSRRLRLLDLRQSAHEGGKVISPTYRSPLPQETFLVLISVRGWVDPRAVVRPKGLCQWKIPITPSGIEPATLRFVEQCLNHCANACPPPQKKNKYSWNITGQSMKV